MVRHDRGEKVGQRISEQGHEHARGKNSEEVAGEIDLADAFDVIAHHIEEFGDRDTSRVSEPFAEAVLGDDEERDGHGVGDPAGRNGKGDIGFSADGQNRRWHHLKWHGHHCKKQTNGQAVGDGITARDPKDAVANGFGKHLPPAAIAQMWVAQ